MQVDEHSPDVERAATLGRAMAPAADGIRERIGDAIGRAWAPAIAAISRARRARMFHPVGHTFVGRAEAIIGSELAMLGAQLEGRVLARCSGALWKRDIERFDVLGIALRFRPGPGPDLDHAPTLGDQDLLFATIRSPLTMLLSPFTTDASDFVGNTYWAVSPFEIHEGERVELRLRPVHPQGERVGGRRTARLRAAVVDSRAAWWLEARRTLTWSWHAVARVTLEHEAAIDQEALRFDPFRTGAGVEPVGLVHAIRRATYAASQAARPHTASSG